VKSLRQIFSNLRHALQSGVRQQITSTGLIFSLLVALIGVAAFASANNLLFLLLAALLATLLISGFVSRLGLAGLQLDIELPEHIAARKPVIMHFLVKNTKWWTPSFSITLSGGPKSALPAPIYIPVLPSNSVLREPVELRFDKRGVYRENLFQFSSRFPFDFTHRRERVWLEQEILVYPCIDPQPGFEMLLRYLARVVPDRHVTFPPIDVSADMHIAVCSSPERLAGTPWATARVVALEQLAAAIPRADAQHRSGAR
jgi:uncharacterized protein (DUF58 family)